MHKCCRVCRYSRCFDESDVSGFDCEKFKALKLNDLDKLHPYCLNGYKLSILKYILWWKI